MLIKNEDEQRDKDRITWWQGFQALDYAYLDKVLVEALNYLIDLLGYNEEKFLKRLHSLVFKDS